MHRALLWTMKVMLPTSYTLLLPLLQIQRVCVSFLYHGSYLYPLSEEFIRPLVTRGKSTIVHWWYHPDRLATPSCHTHYLTTPSCHTHYLTTPSVTTVLLPLKSWVHLPQSLLPSPPSRGGSPVVGLLTLMHSMSG